MSAREAVSAACAGQVPDLRGLGVRPVLVRLRPVARVEAHEGRDPALEGA